HHEAVAQDYVARFAGGFDELIAGLQRVAVVAAVRTFGMLGEVARDWADAAGHEVGATRSRQDVGPDDKAEDGDFRAVEVRLEPVAVLVPPGAGARWRLPGFIGTAGKVDDQRVVPDVIFVTNVPLAPGKLADRFPRARRD